MFKKISKYFFLLLFFLLVSIVFNFSLWSELFSKKITIGDNILTELLVETSYQNILHLKNPFIVNSILYPFTINISLIDPAIANVVFFFFLRPFFIKMENRLVVGDNQFNFWLYTIFITQNNWTLYLYSDLFFSSSLFYNRPIPGNKVKKKQTSFVSCFWIVFIFCIAYQLLLFFYDCFRNFSFFWIFCFS